MFFNRIRRSPSTAGALVAMGAASALLVTGCGDGKTTDSSPPAPDSTPTPATAPALVAHQKPLTRGAVISSTLVEDLTAAQVKDRLKDAQIKNGQVRYGVRAHRVIYRTVDTKGAPTTASELVALPKNGTRNLPTVSWLHGTEVYRGEVASVNARSTDRTTALLFASTGRAVSAPDYLGLGKGPGTHPYGHPGATVTASVDALNATRAFARQNGRSLDRSVLISGFSQGGPATMMLGRALQQHTDPYFRLGALAPVAGPFDLTRFEADAANDQIDRSSLYLAYFTTAWNRLYGLYDTPSEAFRAPYDKTVEKLFDGNHTGEQIGAALPRTSEELFTDQFLQKIRNPTGELRRKLKELDTTCDWRPEVPVHLFHGEGDKDVFFSNSQHCQTQLIANGADQQLTNVGNFEHYPTVLEALPQVVEEFDKAH